MNVRSEPLKDGRRKDSAVFTRAQLRRQRGAIERALAWLILFVSFLGSVVWLAGGWPAFLAGIAQRQPNITAILGGIGIQALLTFFEWHYFDRWFIAWPARIGDAYTTAVSFGPLFLGAMSATLLARGIDRPDIIAWTIISIVSFGAAWFPESRLID